jgi:hypothetical protein
MQSRPDLNPQDLLQAYEELLERHIKVLHRLEKISKISDGMQGHLKTSPRVGKGPKARS